MISIAICRTCGGTTERIPWSCGNHQQTFSYRLFLATWAKRLSWKETASIFGTIWDSVFRAEETRQMHKDGYESVLKNSRWSILKRGSNLTTHQTVKLREFSNTT